MRKVTAINLNNNAFQIDEEGFESLRRYLDDATRALAGNPDREEILTDLEQAIADKCRATLGQYKNVVSTEEMDRILQEMGPVADGTQNIGASAGGEARPEGSPPGGRGQRAAAAGAATPVSHPPGHEMGGCLHGDLRPTPGSM